MVKCTISCIDDNSKSWLFFKRKSFHLKSDNKDAENFCNFGLGSLPFTKVVKIKKSGLKKKSPNFSNSKIGKEAKVAMKYNSNSNYEPSSDEINTI